MFGIVANRLTRACGCATWHQWEAGAWVRKHWPCWRHQATGG